MVGLKFHKPLLVTTQKSICFRENSKRRNIRVPTASHDKMPGSKLMQMLLMLAPNLARMTVASPHLITPVSVAGYSLHSASVPQRVQNSGSALQTRQRRMLGAVQYPPKPTAARSSSYLRVPQPAMVAERIDFRNGLAQQTGAAPIMPEHLVWQDDTWHSTPELPEDVSEEQISDASL